MSLFRKILAWKPLTTSHYVGNVPEANEQTNIVADFMNSEN